MGLIGTIGLILMLIIAIGIIIAAGYGLLLFCGAVIGGILTLIDKFRSDTDGL